MNIVIPGIKTELCLHIHQDTNFLRRGEMGCFGSGTTESSSSNPGAQLCQSCFPSNRSHARAPRSVPTSLEDLVEKHRLKSHFTGSGGHAHQKAHQFSGSWLAPAEPLACRSPYQQEGLIRERTRVSCAGPNPL